MEISAITLKFESAYLRIKHLSASMVHAYRALQARTCMSSCTHMKSDICMIRRCSVHIGQFWSHPECTGQAKPARRVQSSSLMHRGGQSIPWQSTKDRLDINAVMCSRAKELALTAYCAKIDPGFFLHVIVFV